MDILGYLLFLLPGFPINVLAFWILQCMPTRRWLLLLAAIALGLTAFEYYRYHALPFQDRNSFGDMFVVPALFMISFALTLGAMTRLFVLHHKSKGMSAAKRAFATICGFCLFIVAFPTYSLIGKQISDWQHRPPSSACHYHQIPVQMDSLHFVIPGLEFINLATDDGNKKYTLKENLKNNIYFFGNKSIRHYCNKYNNGARQVPANALSISFRDIERATINPHYKSYCQHPSALSTFLCPAEPRKHIIDSLHFYVNDKYNAGRMFANRASSIDSVQNEIAKINTPPLENGLYQSGKKYFWIAAHEWTTADGSPFAMSCFTSQRSLYCQTTYRIKDEVFTHYGFRVSTETPIADARKAYETVETILTTLIAE
jgi:hypothetical protein